VVVRAKPGIITPSHRRENHGVHRTDTQKNSTCVKLTQKFHDQRQLGSFADPQTHLTGELQLQCRLGLRCRDFDESCQRAVKTSQ
jgi:hypothetical protein